MEHHEGESLVVGDGDDDDEEEEFAEVVAGGERGEAGFVESSVED